MNHNSVRKYYSFLITAVRLVKMFVHVFGKRCFLQKKNNFLVNFFWFVIFLSALLFYSFKQHVFV